MSENNQPRNAAAGSAQRERVHQDNANEHRQFSEYGLTKRNEEFMFQLNKQLDEQGIKEDKKPDAIQTTIDALLEGQKKGDTAKRLFGTPTEKADELIHGPKQPVGGPREQSSFKLLAIDNGLMFFNIFAIMFGLMGVFSPKSLSNQGSMSGTSGILAIILIAVFGGMLFAWVSKTIQPAPKGKPQHNIWYKIGVVALALVVWIGIYFAVGFMPARGINAQLPGFVYIILAVAGFAGDIYLRRRYHIVGGAFGSQPRQQQQRSRR
ncbi:DUF1129 domain-containing protein [Paucilactobacillus suebicus]|uniref:Integral membrane protein n=1 Tax=Paucilactobacillus suebicus DSM 5007 = KCTC 3549 TaxID=1423807 RepID=A0A0R1W207_9LACO|nr:DUF1129 domain-containing protein [Paucilactobacillus suebicus]KRM11629.1 hypothetical protein FD16_GL000631 [Paucilactobacillus suebicus DSM 5007 = KCTC 3549]